MFFDEREGDVVKVDREEGEQGVTQEREVGEGIGVLGPGAILAPEGIALPMIADFDAGPVTADQTLPLGRRPLVRFGAGEIKAGFEGGFSGGFDGALAAHHNQAADEGEIGFERVEGKGVEGAGFDAAVAAVRFEKKGVPGRASQACACLRSFG